MTPAEAAEALAAPIGTLGGLFMLDAATYAKGAELGFAGFDFYFAGRGGVMGDVDADVITAVLAMFNPEVVRTQWDAGRRVMDPHAAAEHFVGCGHAWGRAHLPDDVDAGRMAELLATVVAAAPVTAVPLFAAWRSVPTPEDDKAGGLHYVNLLRELRFGLHAIAVAAEGIAPLEAVLVKGGIPNAQLFGWGEPFPDPAPVRDAWERAERRTTALISPALAALDDGERAELVDLVQRAHDNVG
ncbi:MAG: hypothetical protein JJLCMIEE_01793 [Acidimicrobiales bacterium]|nr:MAG: hypothetical protein EDR02_05815 [Actinomycetota bacterium]MBV6508727.1 hypothetical protein [Acidimicrobiales bacterium]RIK08159.1 MAG: hypothetical protein DCC48_01935 [Acidobacteriota bacterium]